MLHAAARAGEAVTYSEALAALGHRFTRPLMRQFCVTLADVDARAAGASEPELAVLVVRQSDRLPGQGWWLGRPDWRSGFTGPDARAYVTRLQQQAFAHWRT